MYAIIRSGGHQYRAEAGKKLSVEKLDKKLGEQFDLEDVLLVGGDKTLVGTPTVKGAKVTVVVTQQARGPKVLVFKKKRRHGFRRMNGHRQSFTELFVLAISAGGETTKAETKPIVIDPVKKFERLEKLAALPKEERKTKAAKKVAKKAVAPKKKATAKKPAKKSATAKKKTKK